MRCANARALIELNRPGELDARTEKQLEDHIAGCPRCSALKAGRERSAEQVTAARNLMPRLEDPDGLTRAIMLSIERERHAAAFSPFRSRTPVHTRAAVFCNAVAFALCAWFFLQSYTDARSMEKLERRLETAGETAAERDGGFLPGGRSAMIRARGYIEGGTVEPVLAESEASMLLTALRTSGWQGTPELERLRTKYPRLWSLSFNHGLDSSARGILRTEGRAFLRDVEELVRMGE